MQGLQLDEFVRELQERIQNEPHVQQYNLDVSVVNGSEIVTVTLMGTVRRYYHKQKAQVAMQQAIKVRFNGTAHLLNFKNEIKVE